MSNSGKVKCTCGWSWNKSDSSKKDMYVCHECGRDNSNNMENGGWLDSYADGGTMQEHQENYNDSSVSLPEGFEGEGYNTKGRNYSPAWGGQFEDGGLIPIAQNGIATRADSLAVHNNSKLLEDYFTKQKYKKTNLKVSPFLERSVKQAKKWETEAKNKKLETFGGIYTLDEVKKDKQQQIKDASKYLKTQIADLNKEKKEVKNKSDVTKYVSNLKKSRKEFNDRKPEGSRYTNEQGLKVNESKILPEQYYKPLNENQFYQREASAGNIDLRSPMALYDTRITPQSFSVFDSPDLVKSDELEYQIANSNNAKKRENLSKQHDAFRGNSNTNMDRVEMYQYDPLAVMPFDMIPPEQIPERIRKYGTSGVPQSFIEQHPELITSSIKPVTPTDALPRVEAVNLPPMQQLQSINPPAISDVVREPKSYNVSRKTYNMKGLNDYYTRDEEGVDYERAMLIKSFADTYNKHILERYGPQNEYRTPKSAADAAERLKQLRSEVEMTPNYQMGGSVYPVNYVPQAAMGGSIPGAVGFSYARTQSPAPSNGKYAKKTLPSAQDGVQTWKKQRELVKKENLKKLEQLLKNPPVFKKKTLDEEVAEKIQQEKYRTIPKDNTVVRGTLDARLHSNSARNKTDKEIADERKAIRAKADANVLNQYSTKALNTDNWTRQNLSDATLGLESKFRVSDEPNFFDDYLNPANMIGNMASNLGQAPLQAQQQDSYMPYVTSIGTPLAVGALAGLGTKSTGQFVNNLVNPLAGTRDVFNNILPPRNILVDEKYMGNSAMLNAINDVKSTTLPSKTKLNELREAVEHDELWKYSDINPADEIERLKKAAKTEADVAYINSLEKQYDKNVSWHDASRNRANPVFVTGQSIEDLVNPAFKNPEGDQWFAMQPYKYTTPKGKNLGYIADEADYIHSTKYRLPGNRWDTEAMLRDMGESANESFNSMYKPFNVNMKDIPMNKNGGVTKDDMGYWNPDNWGSPVEIGSTDITMEGVYEPLLGVSDTGDTKLMKPGKNYKFKGKKVTEYPMANNGLRQEQKGLVNLDNLLNFTNYNTKQPGGWLDKY